MGLFFWLLILDCSIYRLEETDGFGVVRDKHRPLPPQAVWQGAQFLPPLDQPHLIQP